MIEDKQVAYPISYYARRIKHVKTWAAFDEFLTKYKYRGAKLLIENMHLMYASSGEADLEVDIGEYVTVEEIDG